MKKIFRPVSICLVAAFAVAGCESPGDSALLGAAGGAAIGGALHGHGEDALAGAAIGAGAGYLIGKAVQHERRRAYDRGYYDGGGYRHEEPRYPVGRVTNREGFVRSPYSPYHLIDVRGVPLGAKVVDPSCDRIFINP